MDTGAAFRPSPTRHGIDSCLPHTVNVAGPPCPGPGGVCEEQVPPSPSYPNDSSCSALEGASPSSRHFLKSALRGDGTRQWGPGIYQIQSCSHSDELPRGGHSQPLISTPRWAEEVAAPPGRGAQDNLALGASSLGNRSFPLLPVFP